MFTSSSCRAKISTIARQHSSRSNHLFKSSLVPSAAFVAAPSRARAFTSHATRSHSSTTTKVYQGMMGFTNSEEPTNNNVDETSKWETLYNNYQPQSSSPSNSPPSSTNKSEIKIITFDLDNTLWKTSETITHANTVLFEQLQMNYGIETRSEVEMGRLFRDFPDRYCGLLDDDDDDERSGNDVNGGGGSDAEYASSVVNVGRTDTAPNNKDDDGVHISTQSSSSGPSKTKKKKKPVYLTLLRKDAIRSLILQQQQQQQYNTNLSLSPIQLEAEVDAAFHVWMEARTQSISQNFAPLALETLSHLKSSLVVPPSSPTTTTTNTANNQEVTKNNKKVYIGAITDGNSNPQSVPELSGLFDFVIKAEDVGVSKPDKRVYKAAVAELMVQLMKDGLSVEDFFLGTQQQQQQQFGDDDNNGGGGGVGADANYYLLSDLNSNMGEEEPSWKDVDPEAVEAFSEAVGPWWVHIGDDFFKDIVAAKELRMRSVWVRELIGGAKAFGGNDETTTATDSTTTKRSVEDLVNDIAKNNGALTMAIGDSDFLTNALHEEFSDAILDRFADLSDLLIQWNEEGRNGNDEEEVGYDYPNTTESTRSEAYSIIMPSVEQPPLLQNDESQRDATKFCFACGEKIPAVAKFCPGCGERQS